MDKKNYSPSWKLSYLIQRGICTYNSNLHRSLSQIQLSVYEKDIPLDIMVSTSSIIEGVNTSTKNIILWNNRLGTSFLNFFTYKNIMGRSGRMFKYFIGNAFLLEKPPEETELTLDLALQDEASLMIDDEYLSEELTVEELKRIIAFKNEMARLLGVKYTDLIAFQDLDTSNKSMLQSVAYAVASNKLDYRKVNLLNAGADYWENSLWHILKAIRPAGLGDSYSNIINYILIVQNNWSKTIPELLLDLDDYDLGIEQFFKIEKLINYNLSNFLKSVESIYNKKNGSNLNISSFIEKLSHAFLPKNVFYLEEFGLPRFLSKKIHNSQIINLEDNEIEINQVIDDFVKIGLEELIETVDDLDVFDEFVLKLFFEGINV